MIAISVRHTMSSIESYFWYIQYVLVVEGRIPRPLSLLKSLAFWLRSSVVSVLHSLIEPGSARVRDRYLSLRCDRH